MKYCPEALSEYCARTLESCGVCAKDARTTADALVNADLRGIHSHGLVRLIGYVKCLQTGGVNADAHPFITAEGPSYAAVNADRGLGIPASVYATTLAMEKARTAGIAMVNVCNSHHHGACGYYASTMADCGFLSMVMSTGDVIMAAPSSAGRIIGNNPFSYAAPAGRHRFVCFDAAMSAVAAGKISMCAQEGKSIPIGWLKDPLGNDTTDPNQYDLGGALMPFGGHKGFSLSVMVECFAGLLSGAASLENIHAWNCDPNSTGDVGHMFLAVNPDLLHPGQNLTQRVEHLVDELINAKPAPGADRVLFPGQLEQEREALARAEGVDLPDSTLAALHESARRTGIPFCAGLENKNV